MSGPETLHWPLLAVNVLVSADLVRQVVTGRTQWPARRGFFETVPPENYLRSERPVAYWGMILFRAAPIAALWLLWASLRK